MCGPVGRAKNVRPLNYDARLIQSRISLAHLSAGYRHAYLYARVISRRTRARGALRLANGAEIRRL